MASSGRLRPCDTKWYFEKTEDEKIFIYSNNRAIKKNSKEVGQVVNITTSKTDRNDERLKV